MSFVAYCEETHTNKKRAKDVQAKEQKNIFYCQSTNCKCKFVISALNSNKVKAHFVKLPSSEHIANCWNDIILSESGDKDDYDTSDFSPLALLNNIQKSKTNESSGDKLNISSSEVFPTSAAKETLYLHTIRQLHAVCLMNDDDEDINGIKIKEIFAGRKTSYLYTKYISGIKLVECSYHSYNTKSQEIKFQFPYAGNNFLLSIHFNSIELFKFFRKQLYRYEQPILIYAEWNNNQAEIIAKKQIVALK